MLWWYCHYCCVGYSKKGLGKQRIPHGSTAAGTHPSVKGLLDTLQARIVSVTGAAHVGAHLHHEELKDLVGNVKGIDKCVPVGRKVKQPGAECQQHGASLSVPFQPHLPVRLRGRRN